MSLENKVAFGQRKLWVARWQGPWWPLPCKSFLLNANGQGVAACARATSAKLNHIREDEYECNSAVCYLNVHTKDSSRSDMTCIQEYFKQEFQELEAMGIANGPPISSMIYAQRPSQNCGSDSIEDRSNMHVYACHNHATREGNQVRAQ